MKFRLSLLTAAITFALAPMAAGQSADILLNCSACHSVGPTVGATQASRAPAPYPRLNGQPARYLERQLEAYRLGLRQHPQMQATATALGDGAGAMARLYADAHVPKLNYLGEVAAFEDAESLVNEGDWSRGLPPCASCHAMSPEDRAGSSPRLHGQPAPYLVRQLRAYAQGTRRSDLLGRMRAYAAKLTQAEMAELADYYAAWGTAGNSATERQQEQEDG